MEYEWDEAKNMANIQKHKLPFTLAPFIPGNPYYEIPSERNGEDRWIAIGPFEKRFIAVIFPKRENRYRIISIRRAQYAEERDYQTHDGG